MNEQYGGELSVVIIIVSTMHRANLKLEYDSLDILSSLVKRLFFYFLSW